MPVLQPSRPSGNDLEFPFTAADFQTIAGLVYERSGIVLGPHKRDMAYSRLARRLRALGLKSFREYCELLKSSEGADEAMSLINAITTNLTKFFREEHHFEHLRSEVFPEIVKNSRPGQRPRVRIWSAACSSGEEPYSIAMTALGFQRETGCEWDLRILATDLDTGMLQKGKTGLYPSGARKDVPADLHEFSFEKPAAGSGNIQVAKQVRELVTFNQLNLLGQWPMKGPFDVILCRNVMIYFDAAAQATLVRRMHEMLRNGGWFYAGHSESLYNHQQLFKLRGATIYRKLGS